MRVRVRVRVKLGTNETTQVSSFMKLDHETKRELTDIGVKRPRVKSQKLTFLGSNVNATQSCLSKNVSFAFQPPSGQREVSQNS